MEVMKNRVFALMLALTCVFAFTACSGGGNVSSSVSPKKAAAKNVKTIAELFPDPQFAMVMGWHFDSTPDYVPTYAELGQVKALRLEKQTTTDEKGSPTFTMKSLDGIEYLTGLVDLYAYYIPGLGGELDLSNLTKLEYIRVQGNAFTKVVLPRDTSALKVLSLDGNRLANIFAVENRNIGEDVIFRFYPQGGDGVYMKDPLHKDGEKSISEMFPDPMMAQQVAFFYFGKEVNYKPTPGELLIVTLLSLANRKVTSVEGLEYLAGLKTFTMWNTDDAKAFSGTLDLRGCKGLENLDVRGNKITEIYLPNHPMKSVDCRKNSMSSISSVRGYIAAEGGAGIKFDAQRNVATGGSYTYKLPNMYTPNYSSSSSYSSVYKSYNPDSYTTYEPNYYVNHYTGDLYTKQTYTWRVNPYTGSGSYYDSSWDW
ncbi:MAG: hypothetical protein LBL34_01140 [Clostridiales bacterium]|nr:hypothetical protein [Clostridiales bacterium]